MTTEKNYCTCSDPMIGMTRALTALCNGCGKYYNGGYKMSKKDDAAKAWADNCDTIGPDAGYHKNLIEAVKSGWTQALEEIMKRAREKVFPFKLTWGESPSEQVVKLSDLGAIKEELSK